MIIAMTFIAWSKSINWGGVELGLSMERLVHQFLVRDWSLKFQLLMGG